MSRGEGVDTDKSWEERMDLYIKEERLTQVSFPLALCTPPPSAERRTILIIDRYEALVRARRRKARGWDDHTRDVYNRHRYLVEGIHGEAKERHGLRRAVRRGLENVAIQVYLTAAVINLKRLAMASCGPIGRLFSIMERLAKDVYQAVSTFWRDILFSLNDLYTTA